MVTDEKMEVAFTTLAHKHGLSNKSASAIVDGINEHMIGAFNTNNESTKADQIAAKALLAKKWGKDADTNWKLAERAFKTFVPDEVNQKMFGKLGDNPVVAEMFLAIAKGMSEDKLIGGEGVGVGVDALKEIKKIKLDPKHAFNVANDPGHDEAVAAMQSLYKQGYPDKAPEKIA